MVVCGLALFMVSCGRRQSSEPVDFKLEQCRSAGIQNQGETFGTVLANCPTSNCTFRGITMVAIQFEYQGDLHCKAVHGPSGTELSTDAPRDNQGRGESFSPTDLVATALGSCMLTVMGIMARTLTIDIVGTTATVEKEMTTAPPRMIQSLTVRIHVPHDLSSENKEKLKRAAHTCPVHKSLHPDIQTPIEFTWG
jgi:putative redox protein